jgi:hypothetical protein
MMEIVILAKYNKRKLHMTQQAPWNFWEYSKIDRCMWNGDNMEQDTVPRGWASMIYQVCSIQTLSSPPELKPSTIPTQVMHLIVLRDTKNSTNQWKNGGSAVRRISRRFSCSKPSVTHCSCRKPFFQRVVLVERLRSVLKRGVTVDGMEWILG